VESSYRHRIQTVELPVNVNISFGVKTGDRQLLAILNKSISMEQSKIDTSLIQHSQTHVSYTMKDFVQDHIVLVLAVIIVVFAVIIALLFAYFRVRLRSEHQLIQAEQERRLARWSAQHDGLTGLLNRTAFEEVCDHLANSTDPIAMLLIDVDQFKKVNDTYGHEVGDRALKKTASLLEHFFRDEDFVIRFAGDEFVVMILNAGEEDAPGLQQKIRAINDILQQPGEHVPKISVSAGIAFSPEGYQDALFRQADKALYTAKANGRCGSFIYKKIQKEGGENTNGKN
jgi:diguanylate cyclase (GGDEF)-like protein